MLNRHSKRALLLGLLFAGTATGQTITGLKLEPAAAKAGTAAPATKPDCPAPLGYFENQTKGQFGCRP